MTAILVAALALTAPVPPDAARPAVEAKLHGEWQGGACQGVFAFRPDGTYELTRWSPGNYRLTGTWAFRWDALPPTLVLTCKASSREQYVGTAWEVTVSEMNGEALSLAFDSATEGKATIRYTRVKPGEKGQEK
jgi:hypothetical protein